VAGRPIALSTAWHPASDDRLVPTLEAIERMGFEAAEIGVSSARFRLKKVARFLQRSKLKIVSVHNVCSEKKLDPGNRRGDWLASPDEEKRRQGVEATIASIENAQALGAKAVVLHLGSLPIEGRWEKQERLYRQVAGGQTAERDELLAARTRLAPSHLDAACRSLEELLDRGTKVRLGIECRMGWHELPSLEELGVLLERFPDPRVGYWHDTGHAAIQDYLGLAGMWEWLQRHGERTIGAHVHDVRDRVRDHHPPGLGDFDFEPLRDLLPDDALVVLEIAAGFIQEEILAGKRLVEEVLA